MPPIKDVAADLGAETRHERIIAMSDVNTTTTSSKAKPRLAGASSEVPKFEIPRFDLPKFDMPKMEVPAAFREFAEKGVTQAKDNWEKMKAATEEATDLIETSYATASKGAADYGLKLVEVARANMNAAFDYASQLLTVKSASEAVELSTGHMRKQFDALTEQSKELAALAQKVATETAEPIKEGMNSAFKKVA
jgi:phasin